MELLDEIVIKGDCRAYAGKGVDIDFIAIIFSFEYKEEDDDKREHENPLVPAERAGKEVVAVGIDERADGCEERGSERTEQSVAAEEALYRGSYFFYC